MKKAILAVAAVVLGFTMSAQSYNKSEVLVKRPEVKVINYYEGEKLDRQMVYWPFQNAKYTHITDIGSIAVWNQEELDELISDLETALKMSEQNVSWRGKSGSVNTGESSLGRGYITIDDGRKYAFVTKAQVTTVISALKSFSFSI